MYSEEDYWVWLCSVKGVGRRAFLCAVDKLGSAKNIFENPKEIKGLKGVTEKTADNIINSATAEYMDGIFEKCEKLGIKTVSYNSNDYPYFLKNTAGMPLVLYYKGKMPSDWEKSVSVVGSRNPTRNGYKIIENLCENIAKNDIIVVSGMASGCDSAAHGGALRAGGITVAVLGCGADNVYPKENEMLYRQILEKGCVISEFIPGTKPIPAYFPRRNRIVAGISRCLIVGQAAKKSGVNSTVSYAEEYGKTIFAIPGEIDNPLSFVSNRLIKNGAEVLLGYEDFMETMGFEIVNNSQIQVENKKVPLDFLHKHIYNLLLKGDLNIEQIAKQTNKEINDINIALTVMEMEGYIECLPGNIFSVRKI